MNVIDLLKMTKQRFQEIRYDGWESFLTEVSSFCAQQDTEIPNIDDIFISMGRSRHNTQSFPNLHRYRYDLFNIIIDLQVQEPNNHFTEANTVLLIACLNSSNSFVAFNKENMSRLAKFYPNDFSSFNLVNVGNQLETFIHDVWSKNEFL